MDKYKIKLFTELSKVVDYFIFRHASNFRHYLNFEINRLSVLLRWIVTFSSDSFFVIPMQSNILSDSRDNTREDAKNTASNMGLARLGRTEVIEHQ
jgi:hypothetical protein